MAEGKVPISARDILLHYLEDLLAYDLKKFQGSLMDYTFKEDYQKIPRGQLEDANCPETADKMISYYTEQYALEITVNLLDKINRKDLSDKCKKDTEKWLTNNQHLLISDPEENIKKYKDFIEKKFSVMQEQVSRTGQSITLNDRYTRLQIIKSQRDQEEREHEIMASGRKHLEIFDQRALSSYTSIADLFEPDERGHQPRIIVLQGVAGIGKTMTARKIMLDWASGDLFKGKFNYVFYINCREINQSTVEPTIADLILKRFPWISQSHMQAEPEKLLFIVDGFDELKLPTDLRLDVPGKMCLVENTILDLISTTCLLPINILITTRPTALKRLNQFVEVPRFAEILGFSKDDRKEYFIKFFNDEAQGTKAFNTVQENNVLFTMCFIPIVCWIVCTVLTERLKKSGESVFTLKSTTSLYMSFLANLLNQHSSGEARAKINKHLKNLCALANEGVLEQKILFEESDLVTHGLDIKDIQSLFLTNDIFIRDAQFENLHSFIHLSFQEFFAALFYILEETTEGPQQRVRRLLEAYRQGHNHLMLTVRFLFGLLNEEIMRRMQKHFQWKVSAAIKPALQKWAHKQIGNSMEDTHKDLLCCLYEMQDDEFAKKALQSVEKVSLRYVSINEGSPMDARTVAFCMKNAPAVKNVFLARCALKPEDVRMLLPCLGKCLTLQLSRCSLTASCCADLSLLLTNSSIINLNLRGNALGDSGVRQLCEGLSQPSCKLHKLVLDDCSLTASCCADLSLLLTKSIIVLNLGNNALGDSGVRQLCEGLSQPSCKLKALELGGCSLTASCCADLSRLLTKSSIIKLNLVGNALGDSGVRQLCEGLSQPSCKLKKLELDGCSLTALCCADLSLLLTKSIIKLNLGGNALGDSGVRQLCEGLSQPSCKLQKLELDGCSLTASCCADLSRLLTESSIIKLNLGGNALGDSGVRQLCEGLSQPSCKLKKLELANTDLTDSCTEALRSALKENSTLKSLVLTGNNFTSQSGDAFSEIQKNRPHLKLDLENNRYKRSESEQEKKKWECVLL